MYTHCTHETVKDQILARFTSSSSLRVVIATIAFGMGINCPDVRQIIIGVFQMMPNVRATDRTSWARWQTLMCFIVYTKSDLSRKRISEPMKQYCTNTFFQCRKTLMFSDFENCHNKIIRSCSCCDVCR